MPSRATLPFPSQLWFTRCPLPAASGIAQRYRWLHETLAREGVALDTIRTSTDRTVRDSHFTHIQPGLFREGGPVPPLWARSLGRETALVGITRVDEVQAVLVRGESALDTLQDLPGSRIAVPRHRTQYVDHSRAHTLAGFAATLARIGADLDAVERVDIDEAEYEIREPSTAVTETQFPVIDALVAGRVDAIYASGARVGRFIREYGLKALAEEGATAPRYRPGPPRPVTVNRDLALAHPRLVARYLAVLQHTALWAEGHADTAIATIAAEIGSSEAGVREGYGPHLHRQLWVSLSPEPVAALDRHRQFLLDHGFLAADFDLRAWIVEAPLRLAEQMLETDDLACLSGTPRERLFA